MTRDPFMNAGEGFDHLLEKLSTEERSTLIIAEKIDLMSRVALDHIFEKASGMLVSEKGPALMTLLAHKDPRCTALALDFMHDVNPGLKSFGIQAALVLQEAVLIDKVEELLVDASASVRIKALCTLVHANCPDLEARLAVVLNDPVWFVREKLAELLVQTHKAPGILYKLQEDPNANVRKSSFFSYVSEL